AGKYAGRDDQHTKDLFKADARAQTACQPLTRDEMMAVLKEARASIAGALHLPYAREASVYFLTPTQLANEAAVQGRGCSCKSVAVISSGLTDIEAGEVLLAKRQTAGKALKLGTHEFVHIEQREAVEQLRAKLEAALPGPALKQVRDLIEDVILEGQAQ